MNQDVFFVHEFSRISTNVFFPRISGICTFFWSKVNVLWLYILRIYSRRYYDKILNFLNNLRWGF